MAGNVHSPRGRPFRGHHGRARRGTARGADPARALLSRIGRRPGELAPDALGGDRGAERDRRPRPDARGEERAPRAQGARADHGRAVPHRARGGAPPAVRVLMVGGGCRGLALARSLVAEGHAVRAVTRDESRRAEIEQAGCECWIGDPDRIGTLRYALENASVLLWLLATVDVAQLHGSRLAMMLERTVDTTVRGVLYESPPTRAGE